LFAEVVGNGQHYCICDQGLCDPGGVTVDLQAGISQAWPPRRAPAGDRERR
jgi:hypothetical protein